MAGERCVFEFCGGAGGVSDLGEPGPGGCHGGIRVVVDAHDRGGVRDCDIAGTFVEDADVFEPGWTCGALYLADDWVDGGVAACGESEDGGATGADGIDPGDDGG